jgi:type II secretory pathway pseudopilin PulG
MRAYTLIETLIYLALFSIIIYGALGGIYALTASSERNQTRADVETEGNFLLAKITYEVSHSQSLSSPLVNASSSTLALVSDDGSTITYATSASVLNRTQNGTTLPLSSNTMQLSGLTFNLVSSTTAGFSTKELQTTFQLSTTADNGQPYTETFSDSSYLFP